MADEETNIRDPERTWDWLCYQLVGFANVLIPPD
jgi:hypothetical protein